MPMYVFRQDDIRFDFDDLASLCGMMISETGRAELVDLVLGDPDHIDHIYFLSGEPDLGGLGGDDSMEFVYGDDGEIVQRNAVFSFHSSLIHGGGAGIQLADELSEQIDEGSYDNSAVRAFASSLIGDVVEIIVDYLRKEGEIKFDIADYPPRYGSGREPSDPGPDSYDELAVRVALNEQCFDVVRVQAETIVRDPFIRFIAELGGNLDITEEADPVADI